MIALDQAEKFLSLLDESASGFTFQTFDDSNKHHKELTKVIHGDFDNVKSDLVKLNKRGAGIFVTVNKTNFKGRSASNIKRVRAFFIDLDHSPLESVQSAPISPHVVIESSPKRWHCYWFVLDVPLDKFKAVQQALAREFNGDSSVCDLPRVMRLPGFVHRKGKPFTSRIHEDTGGEITYEDFIAAFNIEPVQQQRIIRDDMPKGFAEWMQAIGDHDGGLGLHEPIRGAIASYIAKNGKDIDAGGLKTLIRSAIDVADKSKHKLEEIEQRKSDEHLDSLIAGAINHPDIGTTPRPKQSAATIAQREKAFEEMPPIPPIEAYEKPQTQPTQPATTAILVNMADVEMRPIDWLWPGRIAQGKLTLIAGEPGTGKSMLSAALATHVTRGTAFPFEREACPSGRVLYLQAEDDLSDTLKPRLDAAGADTDKIAAIQSVLTRGSIKRMLALDTDMPAIEAALDKHPNEYRLIIIDPISAYMGKANSQLNAEVRTVLAPLAELAEKHRVAVIGITHFNKGGGNTKRTLHRVMDSIAFTAAARSAYAVVNDPDDEARRLMLPIKNNIGIDRGGYAYYIQTKSLFPQRPDMQTPYVQWDLSGKVTDSVDDVMDRSAGDSLDIAKRFIRQFLGETQKKSTELMDAGMDSGIAEKTMKRARKALEVKVKKDVTGTWYCYLPKKH